MPQNKKTYDDFIKLALGVLDNEDEWEGRYGKYISKITSEDYLKKTAFLKTVVHINWPLAAYTNITDVTSSAFKLDIRLLGTSIATLKLDMRDLPKDIREHIKTSEFSKINKKRINNFVTISFKGKREAFDQLIGRTSKKGSQIVKTEYIDGDWWDTELIDKLVKKRGEENDEPEEFKWNSHLVRKFRSMVNRVYKHDGFIVSGEHAFESSILHIMKSGRDKRRKYFSGLQPVLLENSFFQMATPFTASNSKKDEIKYSGKSGGGIDILARKKRGAKNELCVIELKDRYDSNEKPKDAIKQAIAYSIFLLKLIKSKDAHGEKWFKYFGFKTMSEDIVINAVISMPFMNGKSKPSDEDVSFDGKELLVEGLGTIVLHYMYFDSDIFSNKDEYDSKKVLISIPRDRITVR